MKYQQGDKIIVLLTNEEGTVLEVMNEKMVMIEVKGVRFPAYMDQIDFPYFKMFTQKKAPEKKKVFIDQVRKERSAVKAKEGEGMWKIKIEVAQQTYFMRADELRYHVERLINSKIAVSR